MNDPVTYTAVLPLSRPSVDFVAEHLADHRDRLGTRAGRRSLDCFDQAVLALRWLLDATRIAQLAVDNAISVSTAYRYVHEILTVLAAQAPCLHEALIAAGAAGHHHVMIDGTLIATDRCRAIGPTQGVDLWWSGKHHHHGGNIQVITAPHGFPMWTSPVRPGREHDTAAVRAHEGLLPDLATWVAQGGAVLADLGYEGERHLMLLPVRAKRNGRRSIDTKTYNALQTALRAAAERGNTLIKTTFKALRHVSLDPGRIGTITAAALVVLHVEHHRTA